MNKLGHEFEIYNGDEYYKCVRCKLIINISPINKIIFIKGDRNETKFKTLLNNYSEYNTPLNITCDEYIIKSIIE